MYDEAGPEYLAYEGTQKTIQKLAPTRVTKANLLAEASGNEWAKHRTWRAVCDFAKIVEIVADLGWRGCQRGRYS